MADLDIGVPTGGRIQRGSRRDPKRARPMVFYGTSIVQGACASRPGRDLIGRDGEGTVDGIHPTDLGLMRLAETMQPALESILENNAE